MPRLLLFICGCLLWLTAVSQRNKEQELLKRATRAKTDSEKISALNDLAEYYYIFKLEKKADSVLKIELQIAELSTNKELILQVLFNNVVSNIGYWTSYETFDRTYAFLTKGLNYAKESGHQDYEAIAYIRMASLLRKRKEYDKAIEQATLAFSALGNTQMDSLKTTLYVEMGDIFLGKGDAVSAYRNYNNAYDLAYDIKNIKLQSETFHHFASLYQFLGNKDLAKDYLLKSVALNKSWNIKTGLISDYMALAKLLDEKKYITDAIELSESIDSYSHILLAKRLMFSYLTAFEKNPRLTLNYLNDNPDVRNSYMNMGMSTYYWSIGNIYNYSDMTDSALYYYTMAEPGLTAVLDKSNQQSIFMDIAACYDTLGNTDKAIMFYKKSLDITRDNLSANSLITFTLSKLYSKAGDHKKAYDYALEHIKYDDSLQQQASERDVALLEMERETLKHEKDLEESARLAKNKRNLQFMAISIAIAGVFFLMILVGMFPVSKFTIKLMGYFAFICLFEFIVLLIDTYLHNLTHGEPLKIWLIKIFLIALLVPFQHFLEHGMIHFIQSRKLIELRNRMSVKKWLSSKKKPAPHKKLDEIDIEEDTAVL